MVFEVRHYIIEVFLLPAICSLPFLLEVFEPLNPLSYLILNFRMFIDKNVSNITDHFENTPIQIYSKMSPPKTESFQLKTLIFFIFLLKT